jgi:hypothetical protein
MPGRGQFEGDRAAEAVAGHVRPVQPEGLEEGGDVADEPGHVVRTIGRRHR